MNACADVIRMLLQVCYREILLYKGIKGRIELKMLCPHIWVNMTFPLLTLRCTNISMHRKTTTLTSGLSMCMFTCRGFIQWESWDLMWMSMDNLEVLLLFLCMLLFVDCVSWKRKSWCLPTFGEILCYRRISFKILNFKL